MVTLGDWEAVRLGVLEWKRLGKMRSGDCVVWAIKLHFRQHKGQ